MDPNANWREMCDLLNQEQCLDDDDEDRIGELIEALSGWIDQGGFLPVAAVHGGLNREGLRRILFSLSERFSVS